MDTAYLPYPLQNFPVTGEGKLLGLESFRLKLFLELEAGTTLWETLSKADFSARPKV